MLALLLIAGPFARVAEAGSGAFSLSGVLFFLFALGGVAIAYLGATIGAIRQACTDGPNHKIWSGIAYLLVALGVAGVAYILRALV